MTTIKTWAQRCEDHPDGAVVTSTTIRNLMLEEIDELRAKLEALEVGDCPSGAIVNGRTYIERLEHSYQFECEAGPLSMCDDWNGLKRCFAFLADRAAGAVEQPAPEIEQLRKDAERYLWLRKSHDSKDSTTLWHVRDGVGKPVSSGGLDAAIDAASTKEAT